MESAQGTYSSSGFTYTPPALVFSNATPSPTSFISSDGSIGVGETSNSGKFELASGSNSWSFSVTSQSDGYRLQLDSAYFQGVASFYSGAPNDSFQLLSNGTISSKLGITNAHGTTLNLLSPVFASAGGSFTGLTNTGHLTIGPDVPNTSLVMVGADGHATNVTLVGAALAGTTLTISGGGGSGFAGSFNGNQFASNATGIYLKSGLAITNPASSGGGSFDGSLAFNPTTGSSTFQAGLVVTGGGITAAGFTNSGGHVANPDAGTTSLVMQGAGGIQTNVTLAGGLALSGTTLNAAGVTNGGNILFTNSPLNPALLAAGGTLPGLNAGSLTNYLPDANSPNLPRTLWHDGLVANSGTNETAISSNTIPANTLAGNGNSIDYWLAGTNNAGSARTLTWKVYYGSSTLTAQTSTTTTGIAWELHILVTRLSASVVDVYTWAQVAGNVFNVLRATDTGSTANAQSLSVTLTSTSASGDVNCRFGRAQFLP